LGVDDLDVVILENIGNLVCPAEFDTGASKNLVLLSTNEGDDKPLKYPLMFEVANLIAITKADVKDLFDFDIERAKKNISMRNKNIPIFITSAKKEEGIEELVNYLDKEIKEYINNY
ncbi:MAG TPA: hydrogenase accessory protein HypB, partial [Firmicutes bacterium]|nr:hydrogenase accessory protein HypB [Bacillota bacterium]